MKNNSKYSLQEKFQEQVKSFAKFIKNETTSREKKSGGGIRTFFKEREMEHSNLKHKISDYIKINFKEKFPKNELDYEHLINSLHKEIITS